MSTPRFVWLVSHVATRGVEVVKVEGEDPDGYIRIRPGRFTKWVELDKAAFATRERAKVAAMKILDRAIASTERKLIKLKARRASLEFHFEEQAQKAGLQREAP